MSEDSSRDFVARGDALQIRPRAPHPATPCAFCLAPVERAYNTRWCDCMLCLACVKGIVWSCPVCGAHPFPTTDVDVSAAHPKQDEDLSAWAFVAKVLGGLALITLLAWYWEWF